jgi:hypothetical protein
MGHALPSAPMENERPDDFEVVRLALARQRRLDQPFDQAWEMALGSIPPVDEHPRGAAAIERDLTRAVLGQTMAWWEAGYERRAPPPSSYGQAVVMAQLRAAGWPRAAVAA